MAMAIKGGCMNTTTEGLSHWDYILNNKEEIISGDCFVTSFWHKDDIRQQCDVLGIKLSEDQIEYVKDILINKHDASIGTNWDVIDTTISYHAEEV